MKKFKSLCHGHRFPAVVIGCAVRWYFRFSLRLHNVYRAVDRAVDTVDFLFRAKRGRAAARRYFEKATAGNGVPKTVTINADRDVPIKIRQSKYLNNGAEQDHRAIKHIVRPMLGFKSFRCARMIFGGIELMHVIAKGQMKSDDGRHRSVAEKFHDLEK
jgi:transposase-like protein